MVSGRGLLELGQFCAVGEEQIHEPVIVVVDGRHTAAHGLREYLRPVKSLLVR